MAAVFLAVLAAARLYALARGLGSDYTVTAQYQLEGPREELVNVNTADQETLETLTGIGPELARRIIDHRDANGPFTRPEQLTQVEGIGQSTYEALAQYITVAPAEGGNAP